MLETRRTPPVSVIFSERFDLQNPEPLGQSRISSGSAATAAVAANSNTNIGNMRILIVLRYRFEMTMNSPTVNHYLLPAA